MDDQVTRRIAIFEYDLQMFGFVKEFAIKFAEAGYSVDVFHKDWDVNPFITNIDDFKKYKEIRFYNFVTRLTKTQILRRRIIRVINKLAIFFSIKLRYKTAGLIDQEILKRSDEIIGESHYLGFIGIERKGLIWAGLLAEKYNCPLVYYNLELYIEDNPDFEKVYHLHEAEKYYHRRSIGTLIQDKFRARALLESNGIMQTHALYFPVSVNGAVIQEKSRYLQDKFHIGEDKKILLYFGSLHQSRYATEMVEMARNLDDDMVLVVHGWAPKGYLDHLKTIADPKKVIFSLDLVEEEEIADMVASAHVGLALYATTNANDRFVTFSSSKMAYYARCGVPVIVCDTESFRELLDTFACGEMIETVEEVPLKMRKILNDYGRYRDQAHQAYLRFYNLDNNFSTFLSAFERTIEDQPESAEMERVLD